MPNVGPVEIFMLVLIFGIPIGIGYWCMRVFRRKLRSSGSGFALGFFLTFFLSLIGAAIAVAISYAQPSRTLIATFGQTGKEDHLRQSGLRAGTGRQSQRSGRALVRRAGVHRVGQ